MSICPQIRYRIKLKHWLDTARHEWELTASQQTIPAFSFPIQTLYPHVLLDNTESLSEAKKKVLLDKFTDDRGDAENHPLVPLILW